MATTTAYSILQTPRDNRTAGIPGKQDFGPSKMQTSPRSRSSRISPYRLRHVGILRDQLIPHARFVVGVIEAGRHGGSHQRPLALVSQSASLPDSAAHHNLWLLASREVVAQRHDLRLAVRMELQHLRGIA